MSSVYLKRRARSWLRSLAKYSIYSTGESGEPCGVPQATVKKAVVESSSLTHTFLLVRKLLTKQSSVIGHPCLYILYSRRLASKASNAPWTSRVTIVTCFPSAMAFLTSWVKEATRSIADILGSTPLCWLLSTLWVRAVYTILLEIIRLKPFEIQESSVIRRHDRTDVLSFFPTFGIIATSVFF